VVVHLLLRDTVRESERTPQPDAGRNLLEELFQGVHADRPKHLAAVLLGGGGVAAH
jgi:hypothetical protein